MKVNGSDSSSVQTYEGILVPVDTSVLVGVGVGVTVDLTGLAAHQTVELGADLVGTSSINGVALSAASLEKLSTLGGVTCRDLVSLSLEFGVLVVLGASSVSPVSLMYIIVDVLCTSTADMARPRHKERLESVVGDAVVQSQLLLCREQSCVDVERRCHGEVRAEYGVSQLAMTRKPTCARKGQSARDGIGNRESLFVSLSSSPFALARRTFFSLPHETDSSAGRGKSG